MSPLSPSPPPKRCSNCGQFPLPGAPYCAYCGAPQFASQLASPTANGISCLFAAAGVFGAPLLLYLLIRCAFSLLPSDSVPWQALLVTGLVVCGLAGGVGLLPRFPGTVRGLSLGLILGSLFSAVLLACVAVVLGGLADCEKGLRNI